MKSFRGMRAGKPAREMRMASMTPAHLNWSRTIALSISVGDLFLFGLMHRTYCVVVWPMVSIS